MKIKNRQKNYTHAGKCLFCLATVAIYFLAAPVYAAGSATCTASDPVIPMYSLDGTVTFPPNIAIGARADNGAYTTSNVSGLVTCKFTGDTSANREIDYTIGSNNTIAGTYDGYTTFQTNLEGLGVQLGTDMDFSSTIKADAKSVSNLWLMSGNANAGGVAKVSSSNATETIDVMVRMYFIKTAGDVASGTASGQVGYVKFIPDRAPANMLIIPIYLSGVKISATGCEVSSTKEVSIVLDDVQKSDLPDVNSTWGQSSPQNIQLACSKGTSVGITFSGTQSSDSAADASVLKNNGSAQGIGVQLLKSDGTPYVLGTRVAVSNSSDSTVNIPVSARYIRTGDMVAGSVTSSATYTLDYE